MVGFRIPIQEISSSENIRIKGFLPLEYGNMVIVPSSITGKAGSDFDIDKLIMYLFHYFIKNGRPTKINYLDNTNSTPEERYKEFVGGKMWEIFDFVKSEEDFQEAKANYQKAAEKCEYDRDYFLYREKDKVEKARTELSQIFSLIIKNIILDSDK